jgi:predicted nucleic acid-binding protein
VFYWKEKDFESTLENEVVDTNVVVSFALTEFIHFALNQEECRKRWQSAVLESKRLQTELDMRAKYILKLEGKLSHAQRMVDKEKQKRRGIEIYTSKLVRKIIEIM